MRDVCAFHHTHSGAMDFADKALNAGSYKDALGNLLALSVVEIRQTIQLLATGGKVPAARDAEEIAMNILGYQKVWLRCGQGVFAWEPLVASTQAAVQAK